MPLHRGMQLKHLYLMLDTFNPMLVTAVLEAKDLQPFVMFSLLFPCVGKLKIAGIMQAVSWALECYFERRNRTHRVQSNESICAWECGQEFFRVECGCVNCSTQGMACPPGQRWQACSERADAGCTACSGQRETSAIRMQRGLLSTTTRHPDGWDQIPRWAGGWVLHQPKKLKKLWKTTVESMRLKWLFRLSQMNLKKKLKKLPLCILLILCTLCKKSEQFRLLCPSRQQDVLKQR